MVYGTWSIIPSVQVASVLAHSLDFIIIDREHGNASYEDVFSMCAAVHREKKDCYARPSSNNEAEILHLLDSGVDGIIIPHVSTELDVFNFMEYTHFPPLGKRGYTPFVYAGSYGKFAETPSVYKDAQNKCIFRGIIIEDMEGVRNLPSMLMYPIDMVYIGIYDLACSLGVGLNSPEIKDIFNAICSQTISVGKSVGAIFNNADSRANLTNLGVHYAVYMTDTFMLDQAAKEALL